MAGATVRAPSVMLADALTKVVMSAGQRAECILAHYQASALALPLLLALHIWLGRHRTQNAFVRHSANMPN